MGHNGKNGRKTVSQRAKEGSCMSTPHSPDELQRLYKKRFVGKSEYRDKVWRVLVDEYFERWLPPLATVLDLGCGHCEFINNIRSERRFGMDLNPDAVQQAAPGVQILAQNCSEPWAMPDDSLDVVFTSNFFEHLYTKRELRDTLIQAWRCLRPGGRIIALGPNIRYLPGAYWDFYDHYLALTELSLGEVLTETGFTMEEQIPRFLPYSMSLGGQPPVWMLRLYLKLKIAWPLFGTQFLVVARK
jgi:SAM-dependent methyltransferase